MARFTTQHPLTVPYTSFHGVCMVGDDIWYVTYPTNGTPTNSYKFNNVLEQWQPMECQNPDPLTGFIIGGGGCTMAWNSKIYLKVQCRTSRLAELDTTTLKWRTVMDLYHSDFLIHNDKIYVPFSDTMGIKSLVTGQRTRVELPFRRGEHYLVVANDSIFLITIQDEIRNVYQLIENRKFFLKVSKDNEPNRSYLIYEWSFKVWAYKNKIYQSAYDTDRGTLIIDTFDFITKDWTTIHQTELWIAPPLRFVFGTDTNIFIIEHNPIFESNEASVILRVIDLKPSLKTLSLLSLSDHIVANWSDELLEGVLQQITLPELRSTLQNIVMAKRRDIAQDNNRQRIIRRQAAEDQQSLEEEET